MHPWRLPPVADVHFDEDFIWRSEVYEMLFGDDDRFWDYSEALPCEIEPDEQFPPSDYAPNGDSILDDLDEGEFELDINGNRVSKINIDGAGNKVKSPAVAPGEERSLPNDSLLDDFTKPHEKTKFPNDKTLNDFSKKATPQRNVNRALVKSILKSGATISYQNENPKRFGSDSFDLWEVYSKSKSLLDLLGVKNA